MVTDLIYDPNPVFFPGRLVLDLTEGAAFPIFGHSVNTGAQKNELVLFGSAMKEPATDAGFDAASPLHEGMTNIDRRGEIPGGGALQVQGVSVVFDGFIKKPAALTAAGVGSLQAGAMYPTKDALYDNKVHAHAMKLVDAAYRPFFRHGTSGPKTWLPAIGQLSSPRGIRSYNIAANDGPVWTFPKGAGPRWTPRGAFANLLFGLKLSKEHYNAPWDMDGGAAADEPGILTRSQLGYAVAAAAPAAAGVVLAVLDFTVFLYGTRVSESGE